MKLADELAELIEGSNLDRLDIAEDVDDCPD